MELIDVLNVIFISYFLGSIPFGLLIGKFFGINDLRSAGSGNIGATNAYRVGGKKVGILTLLLDAAKGYTAIYITGNFFASDLKTLSMLAVVCGHCFPIWLKFKGGKGIATMGASYIAISPMLGGAIFSIWILVFLLKKISSLASLTALLLGFILFTLRNYDMPLDVVLLFIATVIIVLRHKENIKLLAKGEEKSFNNIKTKEK